MTYFYNLTLTLNQILKGYRVRNGGYAACHFRNADTANILHFTYITFT